MKIYLLRNDETRQFTTFEMSLLMHIYEIYFSIIEDWVC